MPTDWGAIASMVGTGVGAAGQIAAARQAGRTKQAADQVPVDQLNQHAYDTDITAKTKGLEAKDAALLARALGQLQEDAAGRKAPSERAMSSVRGDILANATDSTFNGGGSGRIPKFSFDGGLRPGMFSANTRQLGGEMSRAALMDQLGGESTPFSDLPAADFSSVIDAKGPGGTALPEGSKLDTALQAIGQIGGTAGAMNTVYQNARGAQGSPAAPIAAPVVGGIPQVMPGQMMAPAAPPPVPPPRAAAVPIGSRY